MLRRSAEELRVESRRLKAAEMYLRGMTSMPRIADALGVHKSQISRDFKIIKARWREHYASDFNAPKQRELAKIDGLEAAAWQAWERSCADSETLHTGVLTGRTDKDGRCCPMSKRAGRPSKAKAVMPGSWTSSTPASPSAASSWG
jgi:hypothetical protein